MFLLTNKEGMVSVVEDLSETDYNTFYKGGNIKSIVHIVVVDNRMVCWSLTSSGWSMLASRDIGVDGNL